MRDNKILLLALPVLLLSGLLLEEEPVFESSSTPVYGDTELDVDPAVKVAQGYRQKNWTGREGTGSCVWASTATILRYYGMFDMADWMCRTYGNGEYTSRWARRLDSAGLDYTYHILTYSGERLNLKNHVKFLRWAHESRRPVLVSWGPNGNPQRHVVTMVHFGAIPGNPNEWWVCLIDNNRPEKEIWVEYLDFMENHRKSGGWAGTLVYKTPPPTPVARGA